MPHIRIRTAVAASVVAASLSLTACQNDDTDKAPAEQTPAGTPSSDTGKGSSSQVVSDSEDSGKGTDRGDRAYSSTKASSSNGTATGSSGTNVDSVADKPGYGQGCAANDIIWSTTTKAQAGYILITSKAKPGITCVLPGELPTVAFGSDGTEAGPAEQALSPEITLREGVTAYAGVIPKTTKGSFGKLLKSIIVASGDDPSPESLPVGELTADKPIVTNWHASAADAVPSSSRGDSALTGG